MIRFDRKRWDHGGFHYALLWSSTILIRFGRNLFPDSTFEYEYRIGRWELSFPMVSLTRWEGNTGKQKFAIFCTCGAIGSCGEHRFCGLCEACRVTLEDYPDDAS